MCFRLLFLCFPTRLGFPALVNDGLRVALLPHQGPETIPEVERVALLQKGRVVADSATENVLMSEQLSVVFSAHLRVPCEDGHFQEHA